MRKLVHFGPEKLVLDQLWYASTYWKTIDVQNYQAELVWNIFKHSKLTDNNDIEWTTYYPRLSSKWTKLSKAEEISSNYLAKEKPRSIFRTEMDGWEVWAEAGQVWPGKFLCGKSCYLRNFTLRKVFPREPTWKVFSFPGLWWRDGRTGRGGGGRFTIKGLVRFPPIILPP